jgi:hypothetical protein
MKKIKHENGKVIYVMRTGGTFVRNHMPLAYAQSIVNRGKNVEETDKRGYGMEICVDDKYFFPMEIKVSKEKKSDDTEVTENE